MPSIIPPQVIAEHGCRMIRLLEQAQKETRKRDMRKADRVLLLAYLDKRIRDQRAVIRKYAPNV